MEDNNTMRALVTGGAGFVGTNLIKRLVKDGYEVTSIDNYSTGFQNNLQIGCEYLEVDVADHLRRHKAFGLEQYQLDKPDVIFHLAALARIQPSLQDPWKAIHNNFMATLNIIEMARESNARFVYAGSSSFHHGLYESPYAWSKFSGEDLCKLYSNVYDISTAICRFYNVYGPHQIEEGDYATVLGIFEKQYRNGEPLTIVGDGEQRRDFTHIDDIVDGLIRCSKQPFRGEIFELGRGVNFSINEVAEMFGPEYPKKYVPARKGEYDVTLADYSLAQNKLQWTPTKNIKGYIKSVTDTSNKSSTR